MSVEMTDGSTVESGPQRMRISQRLILGPLLAIAYASVVLLDEPIHPWYPIWFVTAILGLGASAYETCRLIICSGGRPIPGVVYGGVLAMILANWAPHVVEGLTRSVTEGGRGVEPARYAGESVGPSLAALAWPFWVYATTVLITLMALALTPAILDRRGEVMARAGASLLAVAYVGVLGSFILQQRWLPGPAHGAVALIAFGAATKGSDTGAMIFGRLLGRRQLWSRLSPKKTVEGLIGGLVLGTLLVPLAMLILDRSLGLVTPSLGHSLLYGVIVSSFAQVGDLMESLLKRDSRQKDASGILPGFGGVLDLLDSSLFAAPIGFALWLLIG